jgi:hypothetical protein
MGDRLLSDKKRHPILQTGINISDTRPFNTSTLMLETEEISEILVFSFNIDAADRPKQILALVLHMITSIL